MANGKRCTQALPLLQTHLFTLFSRAAEAAARCRRMSSNVKPTTLENAPIVVPASPLDAIRSWVVCVDALITCMIPSCDERALYVGAS